MGIGKRIKEARTALNYTQEELAKKIGVTKGAIANYENETSHPKEPVMYKLIEELRVDANYLFQDVVNVTSTEKQISLNEFDMIKKYRGLDAYGKRAVDMVMDNEIYRMQNQLCHDSAPYVPAVLAAHHKTGEMTDEDRAVVDKATQYIGNKKKQKQVIDDIER